MDTLLEALLVLARGLLVWRYLFSASYRSEVHKRWQMKGRGTAVAEIFLGLIGFAFTILVVWFVFAFPQSNGPGQN